MVIFAGNRGRVVRVDDPTAPAMLGIVAIQDSPIDYDTHSAIITRTTFNQRVNAQFLHTLGAHIYVYTFGDRIGQMSISGLSFNGIPCEGGDLDEQSGLDGILNWYKDNRLSQRGSPIKVLVGRTPIEGFVIEHSADTIDAETGLSQWNINLSTLPDL